MAVSSLWSKEELGWQAVGTTAPILSLLVVASIQGSFKGYIIRYHLRCCVVAEVGCAAWKGDTGLKMFPLSQTGPCLKKKQLRRNLLF